MERVFVPEAEIPITVSGNLFISDRWSYFLLQASTVSSHPEIHLLEYLDDDKCLLVLFGRCAMSQQR